MQSHAKIESSEYADLSRVLRWFVLLRWAAIAGVFCALLVGQFLIRYTLPYDVLYPLSAALLLTNLGFALLPMRAQNSHQSRRKIATQFHLQICSDFLFLFLLVYFTGFLQNAFIYFFLFHIMLTSLIFPRGIIAVYLVSLVLLLIGVSLSEYLGIIPHFDLGPVGTAPGDYSSQMLGRLVGLLSTLVIATYLIVSIEERIEEHGHRIEIELDRYKSLDREKSQFILQVTHELRGPVAAVKGYHEMILKGITGEVTTRTRETLERADLRTGNLLLIIDEMLDFAYMKSEIDVQRSLTSINIQDIVRYNMELVSTAAEHKNIKLRSSIPRQLSLNASRDLLNIILGNLLTNAVKYTFEGGTVDVVADEEGQEIHLRVEDSGMGIPPDELEKIFEEFYRTRQAREVEKDGTGLGLCIVQKAVNLLQGRISVYSVVGEGTRCHIYLPKTRRVSEAESAKIAEIAVS